MAALGKMAALWRRLALLGAVCVVALLSSVPSISVTAAPASPNSPVPAQYLVNVQVFFRAFCPACQWFVGDPLLELIRQEEFRNILDFNVYPAAGMLDKDGVFDCEGGDLECEGHQWEACIIEKDPTDVVKYVGNLACIEGDESGEIGEWDTKLSNCFTIEERVVLNECYVKKSAKLLRKMMKAKNFERIEWMPYTLVDDVVLGSPSQGVGLDEMQTQICSSYKGPKKFYPALCETIVGPQKEFAPDDVLIAGAINAATPEPAEDEEELDMPMKGDSEDAALTDPLTPDKVRIEVYWRAFCPGCMAFISKPLLKLLRDAEFREIVDFRPVPAAGSWVDNKGSFVCTQGLVECQGHRWLGCVVDEFPKVEEMIEHLACLESKDNKGSRWSQVIAKCFPADDAKRMKNCFDHKSRALLTANIDKLSKVQIGWVPYVRLDTVVLGDARHGIGYKQLRDEVCRAYKGSEDKRPNACQPKRLRQDPEADPAKDTDAPVIKPCPPKKEVDAKKAAAAAAAMAADKDLPGGGFRRPVNDGPAPAEEARELANAEAAAVAGDASQGFSVGSLLFPLGCFVIIFILARRLSGEHKKDA